MMLLQEVTTVANSSVVGVRWGGRCMGWEECMNFQIRSGFLCVCVRERERCHTKRETSSVKLLTSSLYIPVFETIWQSNTSSLFKDGHPLHMHIMYKVHKFQM